MPFSMLEISKQCKISTSLTYGLWQKKPRLLRFPLFGSLLCFVLCIYKNGGSCCVVLAVGSASDGSSEMQCYHFENTKTQKYQNCYI